MKLKPCPFCGEKVKITKFVDTIGGTRREIGYCVICNNKKCLMCVKTIIYEDKETVIIIWNKRSGT